MRRDRLQKMENSGQVEAANRVHAVAADRDVTILLPHIRDSPRNARLDHNCGRFILGVETAILSCDLILASSGEEALCEEE